MDVSYMRCAFPFVFGLDEGRKNVSPEVYQRYETLIDFIYLVYFRVLPVYLRYTSILTDLLKCYLDA